MPLRVVPRRDRKLYRLVKKGEILGLRRGEALYKPGDHGGVLYLVRTGHLQLTAHHGTADERVVAVAGPWEMTGDEGLFPGFPRKTGARAGEPTQVSVLDGEGVNRALRTASRTYGAYLLAKEEELALARAQVGPKRAGGAARDLGALLLHLASRVGRVEDKKGVRIPIRLTHRVLADLAGCHRSTVTTILNDWIYEDALAVEGGRILVLRPDALSAWGWKPPARALR